MNVFVFISAVGSGSCLDLQADEASFCCPGSFGAGE